MGWSFATRRSPTDSRPEISGHFHPKLRLTLRGRNVSRRCFVASPSKLILPAYGSLTGGLDAHHPEIARQDWARRRSAGAGRRPPAALPDRRLGELRLHQAADHIADQEPVFEVGDGEVRFLGPPFVDQPLAEQAGQQAALGGGVSRLPPRSTKMLVKLPSVSPPSRSVKIVSKAPPSRRAASMNRRAVVL